MNVACKSGIISEQDISEQNTGGFEFGMNSVQVVIVASL